VGSWCLFVLARKELEENWRGFLLGEKLSLEPGRLVVVLVGCLCSPTDGLAQGWKGWNQVYW